jgi:hypothetical protein
MTEYYYLNADHSVEKCSIEKWADQMEGRNGAPSRIIKQDKVKGPDGTENTVSTVFLGLNHAFGYGVPILFETMIFGGPLDEYQVRYATYGEALNGHEIAVKMAKAQDALKELL